MFFLRKTSTIFLFILFNMAETICSFSHFLVSKEEKKEKEVDKCGYSIQYNSDYLYLLRSISFILGDENCSIYKRKIIFTAKKVQTLEMHLMEREKKTSKASLSYNSCLSLLYNLANQNSFLEKEKDKDKKYSIFCIRLKDILVINDSNFIFVNPENIGPVDAAGQITFLSPFSRHGFCSPEILLLAFLPCKLDVETFYYSLGALAVFCISNVNVSNSFTDVTEFSRSPSESGSKIDLSSVLKQIFGTKLYWTILRLLHVEPKKRTFLFV